MRVYEAKIVYSLISLGEDVRLDRPQKIADYLRSAFDENPIQEAFYCVYLDPLSTPMPDGSSSGRLVGKIDEPRDLGVIARLAHHDAAIGMADRWLTVHSQPVRAAAGPIAASCRCHRDSLDDPRSSRLST